MIRKFKEEDTTRVMVLWTKGNFEAHDFIDKDYWLLNYNEVKEKYLKNALTSTAFSGLQIELDSINVKKMITTYEEKNEFTSSSKSILANKEVTNVSLFRDVSNANYYYVEVKYTQTSPVMPNEKLSMVEKLNVSVDDDKISDIIVLSIETLKTDKE